MSQSVRNKEAGFLFGTSAVQVSLAKARSRFSLRMRAGMDPISEQLGIVLPRQIGQVERNNKYEILCLGPDEWLVLTHDAEKLRQVCVQVSASEPNSLVDISAREISFEIEGPKAKDLICIGCPRDPLSLKLGEGRRTVFNEASVILWRDAENYYRIDVWHSFADHLLDLLEIGCRELSLEA